MQRQKDQRINGVALESIMQNVLAGMTSFTSDSCTCCGECGMEILSVEKPEPAGNGVCAEIIPISRVKRD